MVGASGYAGGELVRLIAMHPNLELTTVTANTAIGTTLGQVNTEAAQYRDLVFVETNKKNLIGHDVIFLALPHTKSAEVAEYLDADALVIDCGADFRLESAIEFEKFYGTSHSGTWAYGLPELLIDKNSKLRTKLVNQKRISAPGCNATAITLAIAPLLAEGLIESEDLVCTLSVGTSGAGAHAKVNQGARLQSSFAYQVGGIHRHIPEVIQNLQRLAQSEVTITFTPVLVPMFRGILAVNTAKLSPGTNLLAIENAFTKHYGEEVFLKVLPAGEHPDTGAVEKTNNFVIGYSIDESTSRLTVVSALDNLVKGTAGAAMQSMNLALGLPETIGLPTGGFY